MPYSDSNSSNEQDVFSGFGGHPLVSLLATNTVLEAVAAATTPDPILSSLTDHGITDGEQLVASAFASKPVKQGLSELLKLDSEQLDALVERIKEKLPVDRAATVSVPGRQDFGTGALLPSEEEVAQLIQAAPATTVLPATIPPTVNLIPQMSRIRNQQSRGTCVAFGMTALNEFVRRRNGLEVDLSEQFLYAAIKQVDSIPFACGTFLKDAVRVIAQTGECSESMVPYNPNPPCNHIVFTTIPITAAANRFRLQCVEVNVRDVVAYKQVLAQGKPIVFCVPSYNSWFNAETQRSGRFIMPLPGEQPTGGHCMCIVGYQDDNNSPGGGYFIVRNSWGTSWAVQSPYGAGHGVIPYAYISNLATEAATAAAQFVNTENEERVDEKVVSGSTVVIEMPNNIKITITTG